MLPEGEAAASESDLERAQTCSMDVGVPGDSASTATGGSSDVDDAERFQEKPKAAILEPPPGFEMLGPKPPPGLEMLGLGPPPGLELIGLGYPLAMDFTGPARGMVA